MKNEHHLFQYEQIAEKVRDMIVNLQLRPGDKVPSVRKISQQMQVSMSTVFQAYYTLIAEGVIISRNRSGYYVNIQPSAGLTPKPQKKYLALPAQISLNGMIANMLRNVKEHGLANFAIVAPVNEMLPISRLSKAVRESLKDTSGEGFQYPMIEGHPRLVKQIAGRTLNWENGLSTEQVVVTNGCIEAINLCLDAVTTAGDVVVIESPAPYGILQSLESRKLFALEIPSDPDTGIDLDLLEIALQKHQIAACVLTTICSAPSGSSMPQHHILRLLQILGEKQIPLIEDDALGNLSFSHPRPLPAKAYDTNDMVLYCSSFSKSLGAGFRIGWVSGGKYHEQIKKLKYISNFFTNGILQDAVARFLETGVYDAHLRKMRASLQQNLARYIDSIHTHFPSYVKLSIPTGGFSIWMELPEYIDAQELTRSALKQGVGICPGHIFSAAGHFDHYIRINYCLMWNVKIDRFLQKLGILIKQYKTAN